ncbi:hypothetical protein RJ640_021342 [Escallonia rubra]|uniref:Mitochondrial glycoprotein n=1 Tax=Escallonia rubra TaxID=112253 RepID=A0AA88R658_9ASTE|nr:hypothetical protein RJ640_021342 [Escallonia rubra]
MALRLTRSIRRYATPLLTPLPITPISDQNPPSLLHQAIVSNSFYSGTYANPGYSSKMRKSAFEGNLLRLLRNEIQYELESSPPHELSGHSSSNLFAIKQPVPEFNCFKVDRRPGEQWIRLNRKFGENEEIKVEVTMFDGSIPSQKTNAVVTEDDVELHITIVVNILKDNVNDVVEFVCSAWMDSIEIQKVFMRGRDGMVGQPYMGPKFKELDDELQESLYEFLEARGIDDELAVFLHKYMKNKDKLEFVRWMENVKSYIERK